MLIALSRSQWSVQTSKGLGIKTVAQITDMNEPIGSATLATLSRVLGSVLRASGSRVPDDTRGPRCPPRRATALALTGRASNPLKKGSRWFHEVLENGEGFAIV